MKESTLNVLTGTGLGLHKGLSGLVIIPSSMARFSSIEAYCAAVRVNGVELSGSVSLF